MRHIKAFLFFILLSQNAFAFDPEAEGAIILFSQLCMNLYPLNQSGVASFLNQNGVTKLDSKESIKYTIDGKGDAYKITSITDYVAVIEKDNLCSVFAENISIDSGLNGLANLRSGLSSSPEIIETEEISVKNTMETKHYTYKKTDGTFIMRISNSYPKITDGRGLFILSIVSAARQ